MEFLYEFGLFLAKAFTVVVAVIVIAVALFAVSRRGHGQPEGSLTIEKLNDRYRTMADQLRRGLMGRGDWKKHAKKEKKARKAEKKEADRRRVFVLDFKGDIRATAVASLREEITALVGVATPEDEIVLRLENSGGTVHEHGLAASQLVRIKEKQIPLTVVVDKVAASGGYLMACIADRIIAAPFAILGSIGVLAQVPNFHRFLEDRGVDFEQISAGRYKRTVTMFGRNTEEDRAKLKEELEDVHRLFKDMVARYRPGLNMDTVATGEHWYGQRALELELVDELGSSDDYLMRASEDRDLYFVRYQGRPGLQQRLLSALGESADSVMNWYRQRRWDGELEH